MAKIAESPWLKEYRPMDFNEGQYAFGKLWKVCANSLRYFFEFPNGVEVKFIAHDSPAMDRVKMEGYDGYVGTRADGHGVILIGKTRFRVRELYAEHGAFYVELWYR